MSELITSENIVRSAGTSALPAVSPVEPMQLIQMAVQNGANVDALTKLLALKEQWEASEARKAFVSAMAQFKACSLYTSDAADDSFRIALGGR